MNLKRINEYSISNQVRLYFHSSLRKTTYGNSSKKSNNYECNNLASKVIGTFESATETGQPSLAASAIS